MQQPNSQGEPRLPSLCEFIEGDAAYDELRTTAAELGWSQFDAHEIEFRAGGSDRQLVGLLQDIKIDWLQRQLKRHAPHLPADETITDIYRTAANESLRRRERDIGYKIGVIAIAFGLTLGKAFGYGAAYMAHDRIDEIEY